MAGGIDGYSTTPASNTTINGIDVDENCAPSGINNAIRQLMADVRTAFNDLAAKQVSSGTDTITLTTETGYTAYADGTIIGFIAGGTNTGAATLNVDSVGAKAVRKGADAALTAGDIAQNGAYIVVYDASANSSAGAWMLINPSTISGYAALAGAVFTGAIQTTTIEVGAASDTTLARVSAGVVSIEGNNVYTAGTDIAAADGGTIGQQTIAMSAGAMKPTTTNGAASGSEELANNDVMKVYLAFDDSTQEHACFDVWMPKGWDEGTLVCQFAWYGTSTSGDVIWGIQAVAVGDDDAQDAAYGTAVEVTDTAKGTANDQTLTAETSAMTVGGSPGAEEIVQFKVYRKAADGSDTFSGDAKLTYVKIHYTIDAGTDS